MTAHGVCVETVALKLSDVLRKSTPGDDTGHVLNSTWRRWWPPGDGCIGQQTLTVDLRLDPDTSVGVNRITSGSALSSWIAACSGHVG